MSQAKGNPGESIVRNIANKKQYNTCETMHASPKVKERGNEATRFLVIG